MTYLPITEARNFPTAANFVDLVDLIGTYSELSATERDAWDYVTDIKTAKVGQVAYVPSRGDDRRGVITKVGRTNVTVAYTTKSAYASHSALTPGMLGYGTISVTTVSVKADQVRVRTTEPHGARTELQEWLAAPAPATAVDLAEIVADHAPEPTPAPAGAPAPAAITHLAEDETVPATTFDPELTYYADGTAVVMTTTAGRRYGNTAGRVAGAPYDFQRVIWADGGADNVAPHVLSRAGKLEPAAHLQLDTPSERHSTSVFVARPEAPAERGLVVGWPDGAAWLLVAWGEAAELTTHYAAAEAVKEDPAGLVRWQPPTPEPAPAPELPAATEAPVPVGPMGEVHAFQYERDRASAEGMCGAPSAPRGPWEIVTCESCKELIRRQLERARQLGRAVYLAGGPGAPALSDEMIEMVRHAPVGGPAVQLFSAFNEGFNRAADEAAARALQNGEVPFYTTAAGDADRYNELGEPRGDAGPGAAPAGAPPA